MDLLKVSAHSNSIATAGALANTIRQHGSAEIQGIGPKAINQAVKAIAISRSYLASSGVDLIAVPMFVDVEVDGQKRTAIRFEVRPRHLLSNITSGRYSDNSSDRDGNGDDDIDHQLHDDDQPDYSAIELDENPDSPATQGEESPQPPREGRFIRDFPDNPLEKDEFGL